MALWYCCRRQEFKNMLAAEPILSSGGKRRSLPMLSAGRLCLYYYYYVCHFNLLPRFIYSYPHNYRDFKVLDTNKSKLQQKRERGWSVSHFGAGPFSLIQYNPEHFQNFLPDRGARKNTNVLRSWITYKSLCI